MRFLVDEDVDVRIIRLLRSLGHDVKRVPSGMKNGHVMRLAINESRVLITRDVDFTDKVKFPPPRTPGVVHLDIHPPRFERLAPPLKAFVTTVAAPALSGRLWVVTEEGFGELP
jgi:hypothetical protein